MGKKVAVLVGSLRKGSYTRMVAKALCGLGSGLECETVEIGQLPFYNQDIETDNPPAEWTAFRKRIREADAVLFVTPEYNRSMPATVKNAIDVGSRPSGAGVWSGKPAAVVSVSPGAIGGFGANHHLRQSLMAVGMATMAAPEAYIGGVSKLLDAGGALVSDDTREFLGKFMRSFAAWIEANVPGGGTAARG